MDPLEILVSIALLMGGGLCLYFGAEGLVSGSASMAFRMKVTPLVVGLTIVAFGTSSPELVVSIKASLQGDGVMAIGNVIGSNICNIALILGVAALIRPIKVNIRVVQKDISLMIMASILMIILISDKELDKIDGIILTLGIIFYNVGTIYFSKRQNKNSRDDSKGTSTKAKRKKWIDVVLIVGGLGVLILGADLFITGAINIAEGLHISKALISLSIVALGTSLPELATSVVASIKDEGDISFGNAIGSNLFNILSILGIASLFAPEVINIGDIREVDLGVMMFISIIIFPLARIGLSLSRLKGAFLLSIYVGYIIYMYTRM